MKQIQTSFFTKQQSFGPLQFIQEIQFVLYRIENIGQKGENAGYQHFLLFPTMFSDAFYFWDIKNQGLCGKGFITKIIQNIIIKSFTIKSPVKITCNSFSR